MNCPIPPITNPLGASWKQPDPASWLFDDTHVVIPERDLRQLDSYDLTMPSGVYNGKMLQRQELPEHGGRHLLVWYGPHAEPGKCGVYFREILVVGGAS